MQNLHSKFRQTPPSKDLLSISEKYSILYHDIFDFPLNISELIKWSISKNINLGKVLPKITSKNGYYYIQGREGLVYKRLLRKRISEKKIIIAKRAAKLLSYLTTVKFVGITGSLSMYNSSTNSDIDLFIITKTGTMWTTRLLVYMILKASRLSVRVSESNIQKDRLCLNMWMDESYLVWKRKNRNLYTAHELAQIIPIVNKNNTFEKLLYKNRWILGYWPNSVRIKNTKIKAYKNKETGNFVSSIQYSLSASIEMLSYKLQKTYMNNKITKEVITPTRAFFHPQDWGEVVLRRIMSYSS